MSLRISTIDESDLLDGSDKTLNVFEGLARCYRIIPKHFDVLYKLSTRQTEGWRGSRTTVESLLR